MNKCTVRRLWGNLPVKDATEILRVMPTERDVTKATRHDPSACAMAQACRRMFHSRSVLFFRTVAYVDVPQANGTRAVERYFLNANAREQILRFDRTGKFDPAGYTLHAPHKSKRLDAIAKKSREYYSQVEDKYNFNKRHKATPRVIHNVRNGTGAVRTLLLENGD